jgi:protein phosphatase
MKVAVRSATDVGVRRQQNEDSHAFWTPDDPEERARHGVLLVVADGMGGSLAGEVASRIAVDTVTSTYRAGSGENPLDDLYRALEAANRAVNQESTGNPSLHGMGTTCTAVVVLDKDVLLAHVGDSRAYRIRQGRIQQLTNDHSLVAQMVRDGQLTAEQARSDPRRNVVTRSVGVAPEVEIDATRVEDALVPGDTLLLCSDGLHGQVADDELADIGSEPDLDAACDDAIALANERGGPDNITIILARVEAAGSGASGQRQPFDGTSTATSIPAPMPARARASAAPVADDEDDDEEGEYEDEDALDDDDATRMTTPMSDERSRRRGGARARLDRDPGLADRRGSWCWCWRCSRAVRMAAHRQRKTRRTQRGGQRPGDADRMAA